MRREHDSSQLKVGIRKVGPIEVSAFENATEVGSVSPEVAFVHRRRFPEATSVARVHLQYGEAGWAEPSEGSGKPQLAKLRGGV